MVEPKRISDVNALSKTFRKKYNAFMKAVLERYPHCVPFETLRTQERQQRLYGVGRTHSKNRKPVTWTLSSNHLTGNAVDLVWKIKTWVTREWPYEDLIYLCRFYGIKNLSPLEVCHFEDDYRSIQDVMKSNSSRWELANERDRRLLHEANTNLKEQL